MQQNFCTVIKTIRLALKRKEDKAQIILSGIWFHKWVYITDKK